MRLKLAILVYNLLCNLAVTMIMSFECSVHIGGLPINWELYLINIAVGYSVSLVIGLTFPMVNIGKWFTRKFDVKDDTYTNNILYRLLATLAITTVFFVIVNPVLTTLNHFLIPGSTVQSTIKAFWGNAAPLWMTGYMASLIFDYFSYHIAHHIDPNL